MITPRFLIVLGLAAAVSTGAAVAAWQANHVSFSTADAGEPLAVGLLDKLGEVVDITIAERNLRVQLTRKGDAWMLAGSEYPVDADKLQKALVSLVRLRLLEPKTQSSAKYPVIDVNVPAGPEDRGQRITLKDASGKILADVVLGKTAIGKLGEGKDAQYVRRVEEAQSWLAEGRVNAAARLSVWANTTPIDLPRDGLKKLNVARPGKEILVIEQAGQDQQGRPLYAVANEIPSDRQVKGEYSVRYAAGDFAQVTFEDVRKEKPGGTPAGEAMVVMDQGLELTYTMVEDDGRRWLKVDVVNEGADKDRAEQIVARTKGWQFALSDTKTDQFSLDLETLLEPK